MNKPFEIKTLGIPIHHNPLKMPSDMYTNDEERVLGKMSMSSLQHSYEAGIFPDCFEVAGPRKRLYFSPPKTKAIIVTCGGLCPGLNAVIRGICYLLWNNYKVRDIWGALNGYGGLAKKSRMLRLTPEKISEIHKQGGTILGTSRGAPSVSEIVDTLCAK